MKENLPNLVKEINMQVQEAQRIPNKIEAKKQLIRTRTREKKTKTSEYTISSPWDNFKHLNIRLIGVPEEEKEQEIGNLFEKNNERNPP